ncbi:UDP-N-acetylmuramoyl-L-alanyl-D-glutamate--2,6-diaminopimelate ligase [Rickettsiales bacterium LUAb2]
MLLKDILNKLNLPNSLPENILNSNIENIETSSKNVKPNSIFVAKKGYITNGHKFINDAFNNGANIVIAEYGEDFEVDSVYSNLVIKVTSSKKIINQLCKLVYTDIPNNLIAVTGTNGKTSTAIFFQQILLNLGVSVASIGTVGVFFNGEKYQNTELTTLEINNFYQILVEAKKQNIDYVIFEASSEGIEEGRLEGLFIKAAGFTNLTRDHLNYHQTMENYFIAKSRLFLEFLPKTNIAVINSDDEYGKKLKQQCQMHNMPVLDYGKTASSLKLLNIELLNNKYNCKINYNQQNLEFELNILGEFQVYNMLCSILLVIALNIALIDEILAVIPKLTAAKGRLELVAEYREAKIFVDYAHTPSALEGALTSLRKITKGRLIVLFGAGGNRDATKRSIMGQVAANYADITYITDDNPRMENPSDIRSQIEAGFLAVNNKKQYYNIPNREAAINLAMQNLIAGDNLLVAGKGHEEYQIINNQKTYFSDSAAIKKYI